MNSKRKILFLYHGGTIGMQVEQTGLHTFVNRLPSDAREFQATTEKLLAQFQDRLAIDYRHVTSKDSSNVHPADWTALARIVMQAQQDRYDAVAIGHGTDSLQYTATALALALHGSNPNVSALRIPVVLTGAQNSIYLKGGDGEFNLVNLFRTIEAALDAQAADVLVNFWDLVLLGCRAVKVSERRFRAFESPACQPVGVVNAFGVDLNVTAIRTVKDQTSGAFAPLFAESGAISVDVEPGFDVAAFRSLLDTGFYRAIMLKAMGDGNIPTEGAHSLIPLIKYSTEVKKIPFFLTVKTDGANASGTHYDVGIEAINAGAIPCFDHSSSAVAVKVRWLLANNLCSSIEDFKQAMATSYAGEVSPQLIGL